MHALYPLILILLLFWKPHFLFSSTQKIQINTTNRMFMKFLFIWHMVSLVVRFKICFFLLHFAYSTSFYVREMFVISLFLLLFFHLFQILMGTFFKLSFFHTDQSRFQLFFFFFFLVFFFISFCATIVIVHQHRFSFKYLLLLLL